MLSTESQTLASPKCICAGDLVIAYMAHDNMKAVKVSDKGVFSSSMGTFRLADWIGKQFGSKVYSRQGAWVYLLRPSPELWTQVLMHRTQIIYVADIAQICAALQLRSGSVVRLTTNCGTCHAAILECILQCKTLCLKNEQALPFGHPSMQFISSSQDSQHVKCSQLRSIDMHHTFL
jgi:hypothetical protein